VFIAANCYAAIGVIDYPERWFSGERLGGLDLLAAVVSKWSGSRQHLAGSRSGFHTLLEQIEADARVAPVFARHWAKA
jgi:GST-like protein